MKHKIMIVDDDPVIVALISKLLNSNGYDVISAKDGLDALVGIKTKEPDLVILDIMMPEINGYDVAYQLRFNSDFQKVPIILLTARKEELSSDLSERTNITYLPKPVDTAELLHQISLLLKEAS